MRKRTTLLAIGLVAVTTLGLTGPAHAAERAEKPAVAAPTEPSSTRVAANRAAHVAGPIVASAYQNRANSTVTVVSGDTLSGIVHRTCGHSNWVPSWEASRNLLGDNPHLIQPKWVLTIVCDGPVAAAAPAPAADPAPAPAAAPASSGGWVNPAPGECSWNNWGQDRGSYYHQGVDLMSEEGDPIYAASAGEVAWTRWGDGTGMMTGIHHGNNVYTVYMHQSEWWVSPGQWVNAGEAIGLAGNTGDSRAPHLHFEVHPWGAWNGTVDPHAYLAERGVYLGC